MISSRSCLKFSNAFSLCIKFNQMSNNNHPFDMSNFFKVLLWLVDKSINVVLNIIYKVEINQVPLCKRNLY